MLLGIPGLLAISFLDSAAVPLPGGPDAVLLILAWKRPALAYLIVLAATLGSTLGCLVLYGIGHKGGKRALSHFSPEKTARIETKMRRHSLWAVTASVIIPPPFPTKLIILAAGVLQMRRSRFIAGVFAGRLLRYSLMGYVAAHFGNQATQILKKQYPTVSLILIGCIALFALIRTLRSRAKQSTPEAGPQERVA